MAQLDLYNDYTPVLVYKRPSAPTVTQLKTALSTFNATTYTPAYLNLLSERDMVYAARVHGLTVASAQSV